MVMLQRRLHPHRRRLHPHRAERRGGRPTQGPTASSVPVHPCRCLVVSRPRAPEFPSGRQAAPGKSEGQRTCTRGSERRQGAAARLCGSHVRLWCVCGVGTPWSRVSEGASGPLQARCQAEQGWHHRSWRRRALHCSCCRAAAGGGARSRRRQPAGCPAAGCPAAGRRQRRRRRGSAQG